MLTFSSRLLTNDTSLFSMQGPKISAIVIIAIGPDVIWVAITWWSSNRKRDHLNGWWGWPDFTCSMVTSSKIKTTQRHHGPPLRGLFCRCLVSASAEFSGLDRVLVSLLSSFVTGVYGLQGRPVIRSCEQKLTVFISFILKVWFNRLKRTPLNCSIFFDSGVPSPCKD